MKLRIFDVLYILSVTGMEFRQVSGTIKSCEKSSLYNTIKEKCEHVRRPILSNDMEPFITRIYDDKCRRQLHIFTEALYNSSLWAVQMFDASAKIMEGYYQFGHFDECIDTDLRRGDDNIYGKYCLLNLRSGKRTTRLGVCIPNECGEKELPIILRRYYRQIPEDVEISGSMCTTNTVSVQISSATILRYSMFGLLLWTALITAADLLTPERKKLNVFWDKAVEIFSCYRIIRNLTHVNHEAEFSGLHFLRVAAVSLIIFFRRYHALKESPVKNLTYFQQEGTIPINQFSDLLIFQSGFLAIQKLSADEDIGRRRRCFLLCATRFLRLTPLYIAVIAFYTSVLEGAGNGPLWAEKTGKEAGHCRDFWWANLSFINNYISSSRQCIAQSWYLAVTAHCSLLALIFIHLKRRKSFVGLASFGVLLSTSALLFVWNDFSLAQNHLNRDDVYVSDSYIKTHNRVSTYAIGAVSAFLYNYMKKSTDATPRSKILLTSFAFGIFGLISIISSSLPQSPNVESKLLHSIIKSLSWSTCIACVFITSSIHNPSILKHMQSIFIPLSRLSYSALLMHGVVQVYTIASMRVPEYVTFPRMMLMGSSDIFASYTLAFFSYLIIEGPAKSWINITFEDKEQKHLVKLSEKEEGNISMIKPRT